MPAKAFATDADGNGTYATAETEERSHNAANEVTSLTPVGSGPPPAVPFAYDDNGNIESRGAKKYVHDAWNRLTRVYWEVDEVTEITVGEYEYNALHWRTIKRASTAEVPESGPDQQRVMYYDAAWRMIEEQVDLDVVAGTDQQIAGPPWRCAALDALLTPPP